MVFSCPFLGGGTKPKLFFGFYQLLAIYFLGFYLIFKNYFLG